MALLAWYKLEGNATDSSGNGYNGTVNGASTSTSGKIGSCYSFTVGTTQNIYTSLPTATLGNLFFSGSAWIKSVGNLTGADPRIINARRISGSTLWALRVTTGRALETLFWNGTSHLIGTGSVLTENVWYHIAWVYVPGTMKIYLNGVLDITLSGTMASEFYENITIGCLDTGAGGSIYSWAGLIDDVRIYNHVLSLKEIKELSKAKILHYDFDDFQEPTVNLVSNPTTEVISTSNEFVQWGDIAPIFDTYGTSVKYSLSLELKSSIGGSVKVYMQNGSSSKYSFVNQTVTTTTYYQRFVFENLTAAISTPTDVTAMLAFYGTYGTGRYPAIKNVQIEIKDHATPFVVGTRTGIVRDISGYGNNAVLALTTTPQWVSETKIGKGSYLFKGLNHIPRDGITSLLELTLSAWVKPSSYIGDIVIEGSGAYYLTVDPSRYVKCYWYGKTPEGYFSSVNTIPLNQWSLITAVWSSTTLKIYINGVLDNTISCTGNGNSAGRTWIGAEYDDAHGRQFNGYIDDVRIYATALSATDVLELYQNRGQLDNLGNLFSAGYYEFQDLSLPVTKAIESQSYINGLSSYTQPNCQVSLTADGYRIYRPPNLIYPAAGSTMWGGLIVSSLPNDCLLPSHTYKLRIKVKGQTSNATEQYLSYSAGWSTSGVGIPLGVSLTSLIPSNFESLSYIYLESTYTVPATRYANGIWPCDITLGSTTVYYNSTLHPSADRMATNSYLLSNSYFPASTKVIQSYSDRFVVSNAAILAGTNVNLQTNTPYDTCRQLKIGFTYANTGTLGTDIYIKAIEIIDITSLNSNSLISNTGEVTKEILSEVGVTDGLIGWWPLNGSPKDISGNRNIGTPSAVTVASGIDDLCYSFNGSSSYVLVPYNSILTPSYVSVSVWASATGWGTLPTGAIVSKTETGGFGLRVNENAGYYGFSIYANGSYRTAQFLSNTLTNGWHHFVGTFDGRYVKLYADAVLKDTIDITSSYPIYYTYTNALIFGGEANSNDSAPTYQFFTGRIQDVRIYNRALTAEEVKILYDLKTPEQKMKLSKYTAYIKNEINEFL